ncbi:MutS domain V [Tindallia magadiensis]|uniref:MutS domain V n=1 Tax=Tindallia magadiensis TaxID=69895 RepID=A0A1I3CFV6_9FIRM|nr:MutS domain V [Tindallia magadiensis]
MTELNYFMNSDTPDQIGLKDFMAKVPVETEYGRIMKENLDPYPLEDKETLNVLYAEIQEMIQAKEEHPGLLKELRRLLHGQKNIRKSIENAGKQQVLSDVEFFEIKKQGLAMQRLSRHLKKHKRILFPSVKLYSVQWLTELLDPEETGIETFYIYDAYDSKLKALRSQKLQLQEAMIKEEKNREKQIEEITGLKVLWNKELHIPKENSAYRESLEALNTYVLANETKSHWVYRPLRQEKEDVLEDIRREEEVLEQKIRQWLSRCIGDKSKELLENTYRIAHLDLLLGKVAMAITFRCCKPKISEKAEISIFSGRHTGLEERLKKDKLSCIPVDLTAEKGVTLITGANMGGKTMSLKMTALLLALAQMGFWVPAESFSFMPMHYIYFSTGDQQSQEKGLSTFGAELEGLKKALEVADKQGVILLDELASGTNPKEGYGISKAIVENLSQRSAISIVTTHYDGIGEIPEVRHLQVVGLREENLEHLKEELREARSVAGIFEKYMDYRLRPKESKDPVPRDAIRVAEIMGLPESIIKNAQTYLKEKEE